MIGFCIGIKYLLVLYFESWSKVREAQALDLRDGFDDFDMFSEPPVAA